MSNSLMVVATKYRLKETLSVKAGTYNKKGSKENLGKKIVARAYVEDRNSHENNELYIIDEQATEEMVAKRQANIDARNGGTPVKKEVVAPKNNQKIMHTLTKEDMEKNPELAENGLKKGDEVELDDDGNVLLNTK